jgi:hypothetical protein
MSEQVFGTGEGFDLDAMIAEQKAAAQAPEADGQPDNDAAPEPSGQPDESAPEAQPATQEPEPANDDDSKLLAGRFKTEGALFKGADEIREFLGEDVDFDEMSTQQIADYYTDARKRMSQRSDTPEGKPDPSMMIVEKLNQLIELQSKRLAESAPEPAAPEEGELSDEELDEMFYESPTKAMMLIMAKMSKVNQPAVKEPVKTAQPQQQQQNIDWNPIVSRVRLMVNTHGDGDFDAMRDGMGKLIDRNPSKYLSSGERGIFMAYQDAKALTNTNGQLKTISDNRQTATAAIEKSKQTATIESGQKKAPEPKLTKEEKLLNDLFEEKPKKSLFG